MGDPNGGSVFVSLWSLGSLLGYVAKPCPVVDVELPKNTRRLCDAVEREKKRSKRSVL